MADDDWLLPQELHQAIFPRQDVRPSETFKRGKRTIKKVENLDVLGLFQLCSYQNDKYTHAHKEWSTINQTVFQWGQSFLSRLGRAGDVAEMLKQLSLTARILSRQTTWVALNQ